MSYTKNTDDIKIWSPDGFVSFDGIQVVKRPRYQYLIFGNGANLKCSEDHALFVDDTTTILAKDIKLNTHVLGVDGEQLLVVYNETVEEEVDLYDVVNSGPKNRFYSGGVVSHNCEFIGSVNTLIDGAVLSRLDVKEPLRKTGKLDIFTEPEKDRAYALTVDSSHGAGVDHSAFVVYDVTEIPYKVVAKYYCNQTGPIMFPTHIYSAARYYNMALILVEINDIGSQVAHTLHNDMEYENLMMIDVRGRAGQVLSGGFGAGKTQFGLKMSKKVKKIGCAVLKSLIEENKLEIPDFDTIYELSSFISKGDTYQADDGMHDDLVMCNVMFAWITTQPFFKELMNQDIRRIIAQKREQQIEESIMPAGFSSLEDEPVRIDGDNSVWRPVENYYDIIY